jgi:hypothetical protein
MSTCPTLHVLLLPRKRSSWSCLSSAWPVDMFLKKEGGSRDPVGVHVARKHV